MQYLETTGSIKYHAPLQLHAQYDITVIEANLLDAYMYGLVPVVVITALCLAVPTRSTRTDLWLDPCYGEGSAPPKIKLYAALVLQCIL